MLWVGFFLDELSPALSAGFAAAMFKTIRRVGHEYANRRNYMVDVIDDVD